MPKILVVLLTDPLSTYYAKGEIRTRYYNPADFFDEVHFISPAHEEVSPSSVQKLVGNARLVVHPLGPRYYFGALFGNGALATTLKQIRPDVIRAYDPSLRGALAVYWANRQRIPSLVSLHTDFDEQRAFSGRRIHKLRIPIEEYSLNRADAVVAVTRHVADYARRHGAADPVVISNRVYREEFEVDARSPHLSEQLVRVLCVARLSPEKNHKTLIRAMVGLDATLTIVGDGECRGPLEKLVDDLGLQHRVTFEGAVAHAEIPAYYRSAEIFAIASRYEGFCIPVLEAMAAGLPVVAPNLPAIAEIAGDAAVLVEPSVSALSAALKRLIEEPALRTRLGTKAAARSREMDGDEMEMRERDLYEGLISKNPPKRTRASNNLRQHASRVRQGLRSFLALTVKAEPLRIYLNRERELVHVPIDICTNPLAFSYGPDGWHYLTGLLREWLRTPDLTWDKSILATFHARYLLTDMSDLVSHRPDVSYRSPYGTLPWGEFRRTERPKEIRRSRACGPTEDSVIRWDFNQTLRVFDLISTKGYRPWGHESGFIRGVFLERNSGERRFVVTDGSHRCAALSVLGTASILVRHEPDGPRVIREAELATWPAVTSGFCSPSDALAYFDAYFQLDGRERAERLGLLTEAGLPKRSE